MASWLSNDGSTKVTVLDFGSLGERVSVRRKTRRRSEYRVVEYWTLVAWLDEKTLDTLDRYVDLAELNEIPEDTSKEWEEGAGSFHEFKP